ncbi:MAG TPA: hypothetical protein VEB40_14455 [Flavipsychrobacter sp.]|nr:hypothetical protein [Flavipsychrobacter sp.]
MTIELAIDYIRRRMEELGFGDHYHLRFRHFVMKAKQETEIDGDNQLFILVDPKDSVSIHSVFGIYDVTVDYVNELQYEHQGKIKLKNNSSIIQHVRFIQVIPKDK